MVRVISLCILAVAATGGVLGQGTKADYDRASQLRDVTRNKVFRVDVSPHWIDGTTSFWYQVQTAADAFEYVLVDTDSGRRQPAFDHQRLASSLSVNTNQDFSAGQLDLKSLRFNLEAQTFSFHSAGHAWICKLGSYQLDKANHPEAVQSREGELPPIPLSERSRGQGEETYVTFANKTTERIQLFWIDSSGTRRKYADLDPGRVHQQHTFGGHVWLATDMAGKPLVAFRAADQERNAVIEGRVDVEDNKSATAPKATPGQSPNGRWVAFIEGHNAFIRDTQTGTVSKLSTAGTEVDAFTGHFYWSPDSLKIVALQRTRGQRRVVHLIESSPDDQLQPKLHSIDYAKPGDELPRSRPRLFDIPSLRQIPIAEDRFPNPWSVSQVRWQPDSQRFTFLYNQRGHQVLRIVVVDAQTGEAADLVNEQSDTFIDYAYKRYTNYLDESHELIWMSERDGWNHLYLYDSRTGDMKNQITRGKWVVRGVERVDPEQRRIWFRASGVFPEQDPYYIHYGFVDFDGSDLTFLTSANGTHKIEYSPNGDYFVDRYSRVDLPMVTELRRSSDGTLVCELERGDWSALLATGWKPPERFKAKARDGVTNIFGVIYRPSNFDANRRYPTIEKIYAGPHGSFVPKSFAPYRREQSYAELGFVVVQIDGMGTSNRSKAFHDVCWQNLGDSGFPDRILWLRAAAKKYPQLDLTRVGIYGGSAGGQSTVRALLAYGDFYRVGVADCGCHDNRMDKVWWNELWMGWPIGPHYEEQSNVTNAHRLTGKLLLTVGELDRNVDPASTMQVVNALIKADKDFDFLIVPGAGHGVGESPYANRRRQDFFVRHLWGVEPRN